MSHQVIAAVWDQLGRRDIANILREIIGQHASDLALLQLDEDRVANILPLMRAVTWIRVIFDLQRTYLQGTQGLDGGWDPFLTPYLVPPELIYSTLLYLIHVKARLFPHPSTAIREFTKHRCYIAQTLLSGIRVLLLRKERLPAEKKYNFERALSTAWQHGRLSEAEAYLVFDLLPEALDQIPSPESSERRESVSEAVRVGIPSFMAGLYPLHLSPDDVVPELFTELNAHGANRISAFWGLYDSLWAVESALIQCSLDRRRQALDPTYSPAAGRRIDEATAHVEAVRRALTDAIFHVEDVQVSPKMELVLEALTFTLVEPVPETKSDYGRAIVDFKSNFREFLTHLLVWLNNRSVQLWDCNRELERANIEFQRSLKDWVLRASPGQLGQSQLNHLAEQGMPIYIVDCPALHPITKALLEQTMSEPTEWGSQNVFVTAKFLNLDMTCPLCPGDVRIHHARMIEPLEQISHSLSERADIDDAASSRYSTRLPSSSDSTSRTGTLSHSTSRSSTQLDTSEQVITPLFGVLNSPMSPISERPPQTPSSTFVDTLSPAPTIDAQSTVAPSEAESTHSATPSNELRPTTTSTTSDTSLRSPTRESGLPALEPRSSTLQLKVPGKDSKAPRPSIARKALSFKTKSQKEVPLPSKPQYCFSTSGASLLLWGSGSDFLLKFDLSDTRNGIIRSSRYDVSGVEYAAAGDRRTVVIAQERDTRRLITFGSGSTTPESYITIESSRKGFPATCLTVSRDDKYVALTLNDQVQIYQIDLSMIKRVIVPNQMQAYQLPPHLLQHNSMDPHQLQAPSKRALTWKEAAQEAQRQGALIERKIAFSSDGKRLIIATHLGDHHVYLDVWDCSSEPFKITSDYSRSFKLPPWTTNDGDLTCVFFDNLRRSAFLTAFLNKEYPTLIPIPGYDEPLYETYATKVIHAAQSPSGSRYVVANGMNEFYIFDYKPNGTLSPRRIKKAATKMSSSTFKPGQIVLTMPQESTILAFWIKEPKLVVRCIRIGDAETIQDLDLRPEYDRSIKEQQAMSADQRFEFKRPTLPAGNSILEMPTPSIIAEMPATRIISELPTRPMSSVFPEKRG